MVTSGLRNIPEAERDVVDEINRNMKVRMRTGIANSLLKRGEHVEEKVELYEDQEEKEERLRKEKGEIEQILTGDLEDEIKEDEMIGHVDDIYKEKSEMSFFE